ncbi:MAG: ATP synthase F1 subunit gamma [Bacteroidales bacterium]|nr:ATP synthase F1 subunit gamma [Bacteroidales bacterium]
MPNLKEVRNRIQSVITTQQITLAMKLVSAAKLRKATDRIQTYRPYALQLQNIFNKIISELDSTENIPLLEKRSVEHVTFIIFTANRGLCGTFNSSLVKYTLQLFEKDYQAFIRRNTYSIICLGKKGQEALLRKHYNIDNTYHSLIEKPQWDEIASIGDKIIKQFLEKKTDQVVLIYNQFKNAAVFIPTHEILLPFTFDRKETRNPLYIFEPNKQYILRELIPLQIKTSLFKALLESVASEHGARMTAMHKATDNASEMLKELRLYYNKVRQASITKEIIEIISGAEALKGKK